MAQKCSICSDFRRGEIDKAIVSGQSNRRIAAHFKLAASSIRRHKAAGHVSELLRKAAGAEEVLRAESVLEDVRRLHAVSNRLLDRAVKAGNIRVALGAVKECRENLKLLHELGEQAELAKEVERLKELAESSKTPWRR